MTAQNRPGISPNLLKNFNPYDILEPQRDPHVGKLIDIEDVPMNSELNASLLDQKPRYDLVDLFENMYVTPALVKRNDNSSSATVNTAAGASHSIDFKDKLESSDKIDWAKEDKVESTNGVTVGKPRLLFAKLDDKEHDIEMVRQAKDLTRKLNGEDTKQNGAQNTVSLDDDSEAVEDLIDYILTKKNMEKQKRILEETKDKNTTVDTPTRANNLDDIDFSRIKVLNAPTDVDEKAATKVTTVNLNSALNYAKPIDEEYEIAAELSRLKLNNNLRTDNVKRSPVVKLNGQIDNTLNFQLIAMKKDEKTFRKRYIMKPESQTNTFTKGADLYEKSVVLPQIMSRIKERQDYLLEKNNQKRRLVLDTGRPSPDQKSNQNEVRTDKKHASADTIKKDVSAFLNGMRAIGVDTTTKDKDGSCGKVNPIVLMADCNKERLKAFEQGRQFQNFIKNGK